MATLNVNEIFRSFQGEGPSAGISCVFLRLAGCKLKCVWCDTVYAWNFGDGFERKHGLPTVQREKELHLRSIREVVHEIYSYAQGTRNLVITGGEPMLQQSALAELLQELSAIDRVEIETAGTVLPLPELDWHVSRYVVSPKLASSGNTLERRYKPDVLRAFQVMGRATFKFVVADPEPDLREIKSIIRECQLTRVMLMAEGATRHSQLVRMPGVRAMADANHFEFSPRLHILAHDTRRGI